MAEKNTFDNTPLKTCFIPSHEGPCVMQKKILYPLVLFFMSLSPLRAEEIALPKQENLSRQEVLPEKIQNFIDSFEAKKASYQGGALAIIYKGQVVYQSLFGHRKGHQGPVTSKTLFPLASASKPVAATAIALLIQDGTLSFDDE